MKDYRTVITADIAHDLREMLGAEFDLYFVEIPPEPEVRERVPHG